jgi:sortase A
VRRRNPHNHGMRRISRTGLQRLSMLLGAMAAVLAAVAFSNAASPAPRTQALRLERVVPAPTTTTTTTPPTTTTTTVALPAELPVPDTSPPREDEPVVQIGRIEIPKLGLDAPLHEGISLKVINHGPSHWPGTALPGQVGNVVVAGHRVTYTRPFRNIDQLVPGDYVVFAVNGVRWVYEMTANEVVTPEGVHIIDQTAERTATLFACHPPGSARYRYVVHLKFAHSDPPNAPVPA